MAPRPWVPGTASSRHDVVPTARGPRWPLRHGRCRRLAGRLCGTLGFTLVSLAGRVNRPAHLVAGQPHTQAWRGTSYLILPNALGFRPPEASPGSQCLPVRSLGTSGSSSSLSPLLSGARGLPGGSWAGGRGWWKVAGPEPHTCRKSPSGGRSVCGRRVFQTLSGWRSAVRSFPGEAISHPDAGCMESSGQCWGCSVLGGPGGGNGAEASRVE